MATNATEFEKTVATTTEKTNSSFENHLIAIVLAEILVTKWKKDPSKRQSSASGGASVRNTLPKNEQNEHLAFCKAAHHFLPGFRSMLTNDLLTKIDLSTLNRIIFSKLCQHHNVYEFTLRTRSPADKNNPRMDTLRYNALCQELSKKNPPLFDELKYFSNLFISPNDNIYKKIMTKIKGVLQLNEQDTQLFFEEYCATKFARIDNLLKFKIPLERESSSGEQEIRTTFTEPCYTRFLQLPLAKQQIMILYAALTLALPTIIADINDNLYEEIRTIIQNLDANYPNNSVAITTILQREWLAQATVDNTLPYEIIQHIKDISLLQQLRQAYKTLLLSVAIAFIPTIIEFSIARIKSSSSEFFLPLTENLSRSFKKITACCSFDNPSCNLTRLYTQLAKSANENPHTAWICHEITYFMDTAMAHLLENTIVPQKHTSKPLSAS